MKLVWTRSSSPLSILIRGLTGEDCSHFLFVFESAAKGLAFEADLLGTHPAFYTTVLSNHTIVHEKDMQLSIEDEDKIWDIVVQKYDGKGYDFLGALYLGWRKLINRLFHIAIPNKNLWAKSGRYFCDEVYDVLNQVPGFKQIDVMTGMDSPHDVWVNCQ